MKSKTSKHRTFTLFLYVISIALILLVNKCLIGIAYVSGISMMTTLYPNDIVIVWKGAYIPHVEDIVIVDVSDNPNAPGKTIIKRIVGCSGDIVHISASSDTDIKTDTTECISYKVPNDHIFWWVTI